MSAISQKSISGITSITAPAGVDNQLTLHNNNTTEAVKLDTAGNLHFHNHLSITGVSTASNFKTGSTNVHSTGVELANINTGGGTATFGGGITVAGNVSIGGTLTYEDVTNIDSVGLITARSGINITGGNITLGDSSGSSDDRIKLGASNDCHIHHNGTDTFISNDTGDLVLNNIGGNSDDIFIRSKDDITLQVQSSENAIVCKGDDAVELYYNNAKTLSTFVNALHLFGNQYECNIDLKLDNGNRVGFIGVTNSGRVQINGASGGSAYETYFEGNFNGSSKLFFNNSSKLETTNTGAVVSGIMTATSFSGDGSNLTGVTSVGGATGVDFNNNIKVRFGTGNDAALYHNDTDFVIDAQDSGATRNIYIDAGTVNEGGIFLRSAAGDTMFKALTDSSCFLYFDNALKFRTMTDHCEIRGHLFPELDNTYDLGSSSKRFRNLYTTDLQLSNEGKTNDVDGTWGNYTIQEGESDLYLINNRNGKKYKFNLTEVS